MFQRILVPVDGTAPARTGLLEAISLAEVHGSQLRLLHVIDDAPVVDDFSSAGQLDRMHQAALATGQALLDQARTLCEGRGLRAETVLHDLRGGGIPEAIVQQAVEQGCDSIVIGSHGRRGVLRMIVGSDAEGVLRLSSLPVLLVRAAADVQLGRQVPYRRILVPVDGSEVSDRGLDAALRLARQTPGCRLRLVHVMDDLSIAVGLEPGMTVSPDWQGTLRENGRRILQAAAARADAQDVQADTLLVDDFKRRLWEVVTEDAFQWQADVIVLGSHGRRGVKRLFLGSDAEQIVRHAQLPVLLVRAAEPLGVA